MIPASNTQKTTDDVGSVLFLTAQVTLIVATLLAML